MMQNMTVPGDERGVDHGLSPPNRCIFVCIGELSIVIGQLRQPDSVGPVYMCPNGDDRGWLLLANDRVAPDSVVSVNWFHMVTAGMVAMAAMVAVPFYSLRVRNDPYQIAFRMVFASLVIQCPLICGCHSSIRTAN